MDLTLSEEQRLIVDTVRAFVEKELYPHEDEVERLDEVPPELADQIRAKAIAAGLYAANMPAELGGGGLDAVSLVLTERELGRASYALQMLVERPSNILQGCNADQRQRYLIPAIRGERHDCVAMTEPGSGSDIRSMSTTARRDGDDYVINGTKIWTTHAHHANRMFALVRTNDGARQQDGISFILIDMKTPGITTRPILTIGGDHEVNQVFFDDVRVPVANRVGEEGKGWTYGKYLLEFERGSGIASAKLREGLKAISTLAESDLTGRAIDSGDIATRISEVEVDIDALEMTELRVLSALQTGQNPGAVSSLLKLRVSEIRQAVTRLGADIIGHDALAVEPMRPLYRLNHEPAIPEDMLTIVPEYLNGRAYTIFGGTSEIQRDIIAKMMLGI